MQNKDANTCPVCGYGKLNEPAYDGFDCPSFDICPSCGTEFGYDDASKSHTKLRNAWIGSGMKWSSQAEKAPADWDPKKQLLNVKET